MKHYCLLIALSLVFVYACKKESDNPTNEGQQEAERIEQVILWKKYVIASITDQAGGDATGKFSDCILDDVYFARSSGTLQIIQGTKRCGSHAQDTVNGSWGTGFKGDQTSLFFSVFLPGNTTYQEIEFTEGSYQVIENGEIRLMLKSGESTYTMRLIQNQ